MGSTPLGDEGCGGSTLVSAGSPRAMDMLLHLKLIIEMASLPS